MSLGTAGPWSRTVNTSWVPSAFTPSSTLAGTHTVCVDVGIPSCLETFCRDIEVYPAVDAALTAQSVCVSSRSGNISLDALFGATTTPGGTFGTTGNDGNGATYAIVGNVLNYAELSSNAANTINITYGVESIAGDDGACSDLTGTATLTIDYVDPEWNAPVATCVSVGAIDLTEFLKSKSELIYDQKTVEPDFVGIIDFDKLELGKVWIEGNVSGKSYYEIPAINLTDKCEHYDPEYILLYLPNEKLYGTWDSDHWTLYVFPNISWTDITKNPAEFINQQWNPKKEIGIEFDPKADYKMINGWPF